MVGAVALNGPYIAGTAVGSLLALGALDEQVPHLSFLGIGVADEYTERSRSGTEPRRMMLRADGVPMDYVDRDALGDTLCSGLLDRSGPTELRTCLHLFRTVPADMPGSVRTDIDAVTDDLLAAKGVSVPWLLFLSSFLDDAVIKTDGGTGVPDITLRGGGRDEEPMFWADIDLGGGLVWSGDCVKFQVSSLPDTVLDSIEGRPLRDVISHPTLDRYDLTVREAAGSTIYTGYVPMIRIADRLKQAA